MPRKVELDVIAPGDRAEVVARIDAATRWSPNPFRGGLFTFGDKPLKGRVSEDRATVGLNRRDLWALTQPTAQLTFEPGRTGTRIHGHVGMPDWLTWFFRFIVVVMIPLAIGAASWGAIGDGQPLIAAAFTLVALIVGVFSTGAHVAHANEQVDALKATVLEVAGTSAVASLSARASEAELAEAMREAEGAGQPDRQGETS